MSYLQQRAESTTNTRSTQNHIKLRYYLSGTGTLQQSVPAGTAVNNQQDRRRASDGGRATAGEQYMYTANTPVPIVVYQVHIIRYKICISSGTAVYNQYERRQASNVHRNTAYVPGAALLLLSSSLLYVDFYRFR